MTTPREHAEQLRQEAIRTLLEERQAIDAQLALLGHEKTASPLAKKRGRPKKISTELAEQTEPPFHSDNSQSVCS
jgi:hypothetical protein